MTQVGKKNEKSARKSEENEGRVTKGGCNQNKTGFMDHGGRGTMDATRRRERAKKKKERHRKMHIYKKTMKMYIGGRAGG